MSEKFKLIFSDGTVLKVAEDTLRLIPFYDIMFKFNERSGTRSKEIKVDEGVSYKYLTTLLDLYDKGVFNRYGRKLQILLDDYYTPMYTILNYTDNETLISDLQNIAFTRVKDISYHYLYEISKHISHEFDYDIAIMQSDHISRLANILSSNLCALDYSPMGSGKTYTTCILAKIMGLKLLVVSDKSMNNKWSAVANLIGVEVYELFNYDAVYKNKCGLLNSTITEHISGGKSKKITNYSASSELDRILKKGVLLVLDEVHRCKNNSTRSQTIAIMVRRMYELLKEKNYMKSRMIGLSATVFDKLENAQNLGKVLGFTQEYSTWYVMDRSNPRSPKISPTGLKYILDDEDLRFAIYKLIKDNTPLDREFNSDNIPLLSQYTNDIKVITDYARHKRRNILAKEVPRIIYTAYFLIRERIGSTMTNNNYSLITTENLKLVITDNIAIAEANELVIRMEEAMDFNANIVNISMFNQAMMDLQRIKTKPTIVHILDRLNADPNTKFVIFLPLLELIEQAYKFFEDNGVTTLTMTGSDSREVRDDIVSSFNQHDSEFRILVTNTRVASTGLDLDDKFGDMPREVYIMPDYRAIDIIQALGRFARIDTQSRTVVKIVYLKAAKREIDLMNSIHGKNRVVESVNGSFSPFTSTTTTNTT